MLFVAFSWFSVSNSNNNFLNTMSDGMD